MVQLDPAWALDDAALPRRDVAARGLEKVERLRRRRVVQLGDMGRIVPALSVVSLGSSASADSRGGATHRPMAMIYTRTGQRGEWAGKGLRTVLPSVANSRAAGIVGGVREATEASAARRAGRRARPTHVM